MSTAAKYLTDCHECGGPIYENLVHHCGTARLPIGIKEGRYDALAQRLAESERVRRQLAIAAANAVYGLELRDARNPVGRQLRGALAASDALDKEAT